MTTNDVHVPKIEYRGEGKFYFDARGDVYLDANEVFGWLDEMFKDYEFDGFGFVLEGGDGEEIGPAEMKGIGSVYRLQDFFLHGPPF